MSNEELAIAIKNGQSAFIDQLWEQCYNYIQLKAGQWAAAWQNRADIDREDFIQSGYFAICKAVNGFETGKGTFISYLDMCLKTEFSEVAYCRTVKQKKEPLNNYMSFDTPVAGTDDIVLGDTLGADCEALITLEEKSEKEYISRLIHEAVAALKERQRRVIEAYYFENLPFAAIADELHISRTRAVQLSNEGKEAIRRGKKSGDLQELLFGDRNYYRNTGYSAYKHSGMSSPERELLYKEEIKRKIQILIDDCGMTREAAERYFILN